MKKLFWEIAARLGFWIPCDKYMPDRKYWDWVLISYYEKGMVYRYIPLIAEYSDTKNEWHTNDDTDREFINTMCNITHWHKIPNDRKLKIKKD